MIKIVSILKNVDLPGPDAVVTQMDQHRKVPGFCPKDLLVHWVRMQVPMI